MKKMTIFSLVAAIVNAKQMLAACCRAHSFSTLCDFHPPVKTTEFTFSAVLFT